MTQVKDTVTLQLSLPKLTTKALTKFQRRNINLPSIEFITFFPPLNPSSQLQFCNLYLFNTFVKLFRLLFDQDPSINDVGNLEGGGIKIGQNCQKIVQQFFDLCKVSGRPNFLLKSKILLISNIVQSILSFWEE